MQGLLNLVNTITRPNPKHFSDKLLFEVAHTRVKAILGLQVAFILFFFLQLIQDPSLVLQFLNGFLFCTIIISVLLLSCHFHMEIFNIFYNLLLASYGPFLLNSERTIHYPLKAVELYPIMVLVITGSTKHFLLQACFQLVLLKQLYEPAMIRTLTFTSPEIFAKDFAFASMSLNPIMILLMTFMHISLQRSYQKISATEKKREEIEKQKTFLLGFSHELRNLINSVMGNVNLASLESHPKKIKELLANAEFCGKLLLHLVNNILDTGKAEIGDLEINLSPTKIYDTLESIWSICSELIKRKNLKGTITIQKNIPQTLNMDHYRLTQIFLNLIGNAVKFTDTGAISINVEWLSGVSEVKDSCFEPKPFNNDSEFDEGIFEKCRQFSIFDGNRFELDLIHRKIDHKLLAAPSNCKHGILKVSVSDTGHGMTPGDLPKLFQKFTQVSSDPSKKKLGTGLGLFITKELCNKMGGDIRVYSRSGEGTSFILCIPIEALSTPVMSKVASSPALIKLKKPRAMIVDDIEFCRDVLRDYLQKFDIEIAQTAADGREAYQKFVELKSRKEALNIITLDLDMPIMNGKETSRLIREFEAKRGLEPCFIIIVSGNCGHAEIEECMDKTGTIKADVFLKKPVTMNDISRVISDYIIDSNLAS